MLVIQVAFLLPAPIWITVIRPGNFKALRNAGDWLYNIDKAVVIAAEIIALLAVLRMARNADGIEFGPGGVDCLAIGLFFLAWVVTHIAHDAFRHSYITIA